MCLFLKGLQILTGSYSIRYNMLHDIHDNMKIFLAWAINSMLVLINWFFVEGSQMIIIVCTTLSSVVSVAYVCLKFYKDHLSHKK